VRRNEAGFTLVETLMAAGLLGGALVFLVTLFALGIRVNAAAKDDTVAATYAQDKIEELKKSEIPTAQDGVLQQDIYVRNLTSGLEYWKAPPAGSDESIFYEREWQIDNIDLGVGDPNGDGYTNDLKRITVRVRPVTSKLGLATARVQQRTIEVVTYSRFEITNPPTSTLYRLF
jgi:type II secretory pathway pseudopilin PulG